MESSFGLSKDEIESIIKACDLADKLPKYNFPTYKIPAECVNCGAIYDDYSSEMEGTYPDLKIPKGVLLAQIKCKNCGCQTLKRR